jgi:hypothetical protein
VDVGFSKVEVIEMSSIFNGSYSDSMRRVDTNPLSKANEPAVESNTLGKTEGGEKFSNVLTNVQTSKTTEGAARGSLGYQPLEVKQEKSAPSEEQLTNLTFGETQSLSDGIGEHLSFNRKGLDAYKISSSELTIENSVNTQSGPARLNPDKKGAINELPPALQGKPPAAPKLVSAKLTSPVAPKPILPEPTPVAMNEQLLEELIGAAGRFHGIDPNLSVAVARAESSLKSNAVSSDGHHSKGIFQLLDNTGKDMMNRLDVDGHYEPFDPKLNAHLGVGYLRRLHDLFSKETTLIGSLKTIPVKSGADLEKISIAAFNAGEGRVAKAQAAARSDGKNPASYSAIEPYLPLSTRTYVQRVSNLKSLADARDDESSLA